jgi:hypothetical protein
LNIHKDFSKISTDILAQYFSKFDVLKNIFNTAIEFERISMNRNFENHTSSSVEIKGFIGVLLDYYSIDRIMFLNEIKSI